MQRVVIFRSLRLRRARRAVQRVAKGVGANRFGEGIVASGRPCALSLTGHGVSGEGENVVRALTGRLPGADRPHGLEAVPPLSFQRRFCLQVLRCVPRVTVDFETVWKNPDPGWRGLRLSACTRRGASHPFKSSTSPPPGRSRRSCAAAPLAARRPLPIREWPDVRDRPAQILPRARGRGTRRSTSDRTQAGRRC